MADNILWQSGDDINETNLAEAQALAMTSGYVERGLGISGDFANNNFDVNSGLAIPAQNNKAYIVSVDARNGVSLPAPTGMNYVYLAIDLGADSVSLHVDTDDTPPSNPNIKLGEIDGSAETVTELNRNPDGQFDTITVTNPGSAPFAADPHDNSAHSTNYAAETHDHSGGTISPTTVDASSGIFDNLHTPARYGQAIIRVDSGGTIHAEGPTGSINSGSDAQTIIQAGANWLGSNGGGILYITPGTYDLAGPITPSSNTTVLGSGPATVLNATSEATPHIVVTGEDNVEVQNLKLTASGTNYSPGRGAIRIADPNDSGLEQHDCLVENVHISGGALAGVVSGIGSYATRVRNCVIEGVAEHGVYFSSQQTRGLIEGNLIRNVGQDGVKIRKGEGADVSDNHIDGASGFGLLAENGVTGQFDGNMVENTGQNGIRIRTNNFTVEGGTVRNAGDFGIRVLPLDTATISGVTIRNVTVIEPQNSGIWLQDTYNSSVSDCRIMNYGQAASSSSPAWHGIRVRGDSDRNYITNCQIRADVMSRYGIHVQDSTCDATWINSCDLRLSGVGSALNDEGTGTVTTNNQTSTA